MLTPDEWVRYGVERIKFELVKSLLIIQNYFTNNHLLSSRKRNIIVMEAKPMEYMTLIEAEEKWNISPRQINYCCSDGRIPRAEKPGERS